MGKPRIDTTYPGTAGRADSRHWGPGYPNGQTAKMVPLVVDRVEFPAGIRPEVHDLAALLLEWSIARGWLPSGGLDVGSCWGYANRAIKPPPGAPPTNIPSNHSWGLALDINAPENPYTGTHHEIPAVMGKLWNLYGWRWGGDYPNSKDWMHMEFMGTPADARAMTAAARIELGTGDDDVKELEQYEQGQDDYWAALDKGKGVDPGEAPEKWPLHRKRGWRHARKAANNPKPIKV